MNKVLFIMEKPSVAMEYVKLLNIKGNKYKGYIESDRAVFTWCVGHMITMSYPEVYNKNLKKWSLNTIPFLPNNYKYEVISTAANQFNVVSFLLKRKDIDKIYVCTDSGREGEYIYRLVDQMVGVKEKEKKRVWIDSQTEEEIKRGIKEAKSLSEYNSLADSAYLRAKEDYLFGINFSRLLTLIYGKVVSNILGIDRVVIAVGRVMTCVLGMIVKREIQIKEFKKDFFYKIKSEFKKDEKYVYEGEWKAVKNSKYFSSNILYNDNGFKKIEDAKKFISQLKNDKDIIGVIDKVKKSSENKKAPLLFNLAELQNECSKKFKISPDETLNKIQNLYEKKMITYPRTDARVLSKAVAKEINKNIKKLTYYKENIEIKSISENILKNGWYKNLQKTKYVNDSKITDHYAIIPTGEGLKNYNKLNILEKEIYNLIIRRFLAIFYPSAKYSKILVVTKLGKERFFTSYKICTHEGYLTVLNKNTKESKNKTFLMNLKRGDKVCINGLKIKRGETSAPKRYTTGSIIIAMENAGRLIENDELREEIKGRGIGTSATRAEILRKLDKIQYVNVNKKTQILAPTVKGEMIYEVIKASIPNLLNPDLTASWEKGLKMVVDKEIDSKIFMNKLENYIRNNVYRVLNENNVIDAEKLFFKVIENNNIKIDKSKQDNILGICPLCKNGQIIKNSKGYGCSNWKNGCKFFVGQICNKKIPINEIKKLIKYKKTGVIKDFKSKKGVNFQARLIIKEGKIQFDFNT